MKKLFTLSVFGLAGSIFAQTTLYSENFNGGTHTFTLNSSDQSSTASGANHWVVNNNYSGGSYTPTCIGFSTSIASTTSQPGGITGAPNSTYLHVNCVEAGNQGVLNANFLASDNGVIGCAYDENYFAKMTTPISTTGMTGVTLSFWWMCAGSAATYGELYYSTNGGSSWNLQQSNMQGQSSWIQANLTNALWDNQASLMFGFRFVNNFTFSAFDPPLCVDDILVSVPAASTITTGSLNPTTMCAGASLNVPYSITGSFTGGNTFTAQLSNSIGSFASPTNIGNVTSTTAGTIVATIPVGTTTGSGYLVRVVSSTPAITGTSSGPITINGLPSAVAGSNGTICAGNTIQLTSGGGSTYTWLGPNSFSSSNQNPSITGSTTAMSGVYTVTVTSSDGCTSTATTSAFVVDCSGIENEVVFDANIYPNPTQDIFTISVDDSFSGNTQIQIMNLVGEVIYSGMIANSNTQLSSKTLNMKAGVYLVRMVYKNQNKVIRLIVK